MIGQALFVGTEAASVHVSDILAKPGVSGRVDAEPHRHGFYPAALGRDGQAAVPS